MIQVANTGDRDAQSLSRSDANPGHRLNSLSIRTLFQIRDLVHGDQSTPVFIDEAKLQLSQLEVLLCGSDDHLRNRQRGRRGRRGSIAHMQHPSLLIHKEIVKQHAIWRERLHAHPGGAGQQISRAQLGQVALERLEEGSFAKIPIQLFRVRRASTWTQACESRGIAASPRAHLR